MIILSESKNLFLSRGLIAGILKPPGTYKRSTDKCKLKLILTVLKIKLWSPCMGSSVTPPPRGRWRFDLTYICCPLSPNLVAFRFKFSIYIHEELSALRVKTMVLKSWLANHFFDSEWCWGIRATFITFKNNKVNMMPQTICSTSAADNSVFILILWSNTAENLCFKFIGFCSWVTLVFQLFVFIPSTIKVQKKNTAHTPNMNLKQW